MQLEICIDTLLGAQRALQSGADRLEVCGCLSAGGITPPPSLITACCHLAPGRCMVMIRPRTGSFCYDASELECMERDIAFAREAGARGVVWGALDEQRHVDEAAVERLMEASQGLDVTFHRAFDVTADLAAALETLRSLRVPRVLTSGGQLTAVAGQRELTKLVQQAAGQIAILPGSGIRPDNVVALVQATGVSEVHASARLRPPAPGCNPVAQPTPATQPTSAIHPSAFAPSAESLAPDLQVLLASMAADAQGECDAATVRQLRHLLDALPELH